MSSFKGNEDWLQTSILYEILPLNRVMELYIMYTQICKIDRNETFVYMFVFSLNRLVGVREFDCLQPFYTNTHAAFFIQRKTTLGQINLACFFGVNKTFVCLTSNCAKFPFKQIFLSLFIHFSV